MIRIGAYTGAGFGNSSPQKAGIALNTVTDDTLTRFTSPVNTAHGVECPFCCSRRYRWPWLRGAMACIRRFLAH